MLYDLNVLNVIQITQMVSMVSILDMTWDNFILGQPESSPFAINAETGSISLISDLTQSIYSETSSFKLNVSATDDGSCCQPGTRNLILVTLSASSYGTM